MTVIAHTTEATEIDDRRRRALFNVLSERFQGDLRAMATTLSMHPSELVELLWPGAAVRVWSLFNRTSTD